MAFQNTLNADRGSEKSQIHLINLLREMVKKMELMDRFIHEWPVE